MNDGDEKPASDRHVTERHVIGVPADLWAQFGQLVGERGRSEKIREFIRRYVEGKSTRGHR